MKIDNTIIPMSIFNIDAKEQTHKNLAEENGNFMWFQLVMYVLINMINVTKSNEEVHEICRQQGVDIDVNNREPFYQVLRRISDDEDAKKSIPELVDLCRQQYADNDSQLQTINEFQRNYENWFSIWWYTRDSFVYRLLNKALRQQNIDILFLFRFLIHDIYILLQEQQKDFDQDIILLYRGQWLHKAEFESLKNSKGQYISMNSFLSTTKNRQLAVIYAGLDDTGKNLTSVLFEIEANTRRSDLKPFADISNMSQFGEGETEILFMIGSIFKINDIYFNITDQIWEIKLELSSENDKELKDVYLSLKNEVGEEVSLLSLGHVLLQMSDNDRAIQCYRRALKQLPIEHPFIQRCYYALGDALSEKHDYEQALFYYQQALNLEINSVGSPYLIGDIYNSIGMIYFDKVDYEKALIHYQKALDIFLNSIGYNELRTANVYGNIANLYHRQKIYDLAEKNYCECLKIGQNLLPDNHPHNAQTLMNIGVLKMNQGDYKLALEYYKQCQKIQLVALPSEHPALGDCYVNIGDAYARMGESNSALKNYRTAMEIYKKSISLADPKFVQLSWRINTLNNS
jgi:tetratricopeptide (TPR) repeat protein